MGGIVKKLASPITSLLGVGGGGGSPAVASPTPDDRLGRVNREREAVRRYGSAGRVSTLLDDGKLG